MERKHLILIILIIVSGIAYYQWTAETTTTNTQVQVTRIVDGDTIEIILNNVTEKVRLKGINTPERSMPAYSEAKNFLANLIDNRTIGLENHGRDKYGRILGYIYLNNKNINQKILEEGLGTFYYYEEDPHYDDLKKSEARARESEIGIWAPSPMKGCIELTKLQYEEEGGRCIDGEKLILENSCPPIKTIIKDDATHIYKENIPTGTWEKSFSCIWNDAGDTVYIWDEEGGLLLFWRY